MEPKKNNQYLKPCIYKIKVKGELEAKWNNYLSGATIEIEESENIGLTSSIIIEIKDQAELVGIINALHNFNIEVLFIRPIERNEGPCQHNMN